MGEAINWSTTASVVGGPVISQTGQARPDGYDKLEVTLDAQKSKTLTLAPGKWTELQFLLISPAKNDWQLTYDSGAGDTALPGPLLLLGATGLLGTGNAVLTLKNNHLTDSVSIDILVGRSN